MKAWASNTKTKAKSARKRTEQPIRVWYTTLRTQSASENAKIPTYMGNSRTACRLAVAASMVKPIVAKEEKGAVVKRQFRHWQTT